MDQIITEREEIAVKLTSMVGDRVTLFSEIFGDELEVGLFGLLKRGSYVSDGWQVALSAEHSAFSIMFNTNAVRQIVVPHPQDRRGMSTQIHLRLRRGRNREYEEFT